VDEVVPQRIVHQDEDLSDLRKTLSRVLGARLDAARRSYGDELRLHLGQLTTFQSPLLAGKTRGEWLLGTRASQWRLIQPGTAQIDRDAAWDDAAWHELVGKRVTVLDVTYPDVTLTLGFETGARFCVPGNGAGDYLAAWEFFTPDQLVITAGPGRRWDASATDAPSTD